MALFCCSLHYGQQTKVISGQVLESGTNSPIHNANVYLKGLPKEVLSDTQGYFELISIETGEKILRIETGGFFPKQLRIDLSEESIDLGRIFLERDITTEKTDNLITLTEGELLDNEEALSGAMGLLQSTRDVFLNRAAFDFGQAFFRVRGYDSRNGMVLINGIPMNKFFDGRPQWNNWGGLNDVVRNQEYTHGLATNPYTFGGILGNTNIDVRPSTMRPGTRLSSSASNRTYNGRLMGTYSSGLSDGGWAYSFSASRRWAKEGYVDGTLYDAYSFFGSVEFRPNTSNSISLTSILARNRRGRSSAITEEVYNLKGNRYNPYWGEQEGGIRNSREREIFEPIFLLNYKFQTDRLYWSSGVGYQFGTYGRSRLGYYNASNPDPTYYRYLPSYAVNSSIGASFINADIAKEAFLQDAQLNWTQLYESNQNNEGRAAYLLYDDVVADNSIIMATNVKYRLADRIDIGFGGHYRNLASENYAEITDLLGAGFHQDIDTFSDTRNDIDGSLEKTKGERFNYNYDLYGNEIAAFAQTAFQGKSWDGFAAVTLTGFKIQREGRFANERFPESSLGKSEEVSFSNMGFKGGLRYFLTRRHWFEANAAKIDKSPTVQNIFINPRENNKTVPGIAAETITTLDLNYHLRLPDITGRISAFYTRFQNTTDINFFFVDSGLGSDFVQEVITGLDRLHRGIEFGFEYAISSNVKLSAAGNFGDYVYASDPMVQINFDTAGPEEDLIDPGGTIDLGTANLKGLKLAQGPQTALALGIEYRDPKYWWISATANHLTNNYLNLSTITRTQSFLLNPETGEPFPGATSENVEKLLEQKELDDIYLLNLVGGKSWLWGKKYISVFMSVNNLFDTVFRTGGYEQSRNGNFGQLQQDNLSGSPSFGPKYWYGFGRTYFINLAISF